MLFIFPSGVGHIDNSASTPEQDDEACAANMRALMTTPTTNLPSPDANILEAPTPPTDLAEVLLTVTQTQPASTTTKRKAPKTKSTAGLSNEPPAKTTKVKSGTHLQNFANGELTGNLNDNTG